MVELLAPNGKPSNLNAEQYKLVRTKEFKDWFGDWEKLALTKINDSGIDEISLKRLEDGVSKVVDSNGEPLVLNHSTKKNQKEDGSYEDYFDVDSWLQESGNYVFSTPNSSVNPIFLSRKGEYALSDDIWQIKFFANIKNLFDTDNKNHLKKLQEYTIKTYSKYGDYNEMVEDLYGGGYETFEVDYKIGEKRNKWENSGSIPALINEMGYDAYINNDENVIVVFDRNKLKLADGTNTTFDSNNPDIRYNDGGYIRNIKKLYTEDESDVYGGDFGQAGGINWRINPETNFLYLMGIGRNNRGENSGESKGEGSKALAYLFELYPEVDKIYFQIEGEEDAWKFYKKIGAEAEGGTEIDENTYDAELSRTALRNYFVQKNNPDIRFDNGGELNVKQLNQKFLNHFKNNTGFNISDIPKELINKYPIWKYGNLTYSNEIDDDNTLYAGVKKGRDLNDISSWSFDSETAEAFAEKYDDGEVVELTPKEFRNSFDFVSLDVISDYLYANGLNTEETDEYYSELEVYAFPKKVKSSKNKSNTEIRFDGGGETNENLMQAQVKEIIYHRSNPIFRESILKQGLIPKGLSESWLSDTPIEGEVIFATNSSDISDAWDSGYDDDTYEIDTTQLNNKWYLDPNFGSDENNRIITFEPIPLKAIKLVYEGSGESIWENGGQVIINPTEIECHKCHWHWKVKDGGDDLFICHKCFTDNSKYYKFEGLEGQKILDTISFKTGGQSLSKTPAPKKERIYGSEKNKPESSKDTKSAEKIEFNEKTLETIKNKVAEHNKKNPNKKVTLASAKAVVRRGMGAYSSTHRPTISGGKPNSRVAWGLARLNAFFYKIINGKSKSGKYSQDDDLINELGYKVAKFENGGDVQAYEDAMGISEFDEGGETTPKKIYVSIELKTEIEGDYPNYFFRYNEKPFEELKNGVLEGVTGVSSSTSNVAEWFSTKDCLIVMDYEKFMASNQTETINYNDPYQLMANKLFLFKRLYGNITRYGEQENVYQQTLASICPKIRKEIMLEMEISEGQKYRELYRIDRFLDPNITSAFYRWANKKQDIESPIDLTNAILEFNKIDDSYLGDGFENPVLTFDELLPLVEIGIINAGTIWESEQEIILKNRTLVLPKQSQLFFINKDEIGRVRASNQLDLIDKYKLKDLYKVYFVDRQDVEKYRTIWKNKYYQEKELQYEKSKYNLELKKDQVVNELFGIFINNSFKSFKEQYEKDYISDLSESRMFYDTESDDYEEIYWQEIVLVQFILNEYIKIVQRNWKRFIESKSVENLNLYSFSNLFDEVKYELQEFFDKNKDELEKINNWKEIRGNGYLNLSGIEYLLKKSVDDYENLPEWIDYKELSKMYLDKMGRELYRYYDKKDLPLISQYKDGGKTDEPTHFWGKEAGGVLVYCSTTNRYLILLRSDWVLEPNTWNIISGKIDEGENVQEAVLREAEEETGHKLSNLIPSFIFEKENFKFYNFVSIVNQEFEPKLNWENDDYKWVELNEMPENLHFGLKLLLEKENIENLIEKNKNMIHEQNPKDTITMDIPLLIRFSELMREDVKSDVELHQIIENLIDMKDKGVLTMNDYDMILGKNIEVEEKMENGGKVQTINSKKGDIQISLDENWYDDDTSVELVPVSELIKFREFDRKVEPKYNQDNSRDNINHLKYMFQKEGVKSPLIIEYSPEDNAVLIIEGNHRLNSAIDLGMEYLPARVVLRKYGGFSPSKIKNTMQVAGIQPNEANYIPSDLKPSQVGIPNTKPLAFGDGGIIEGRLHSECGDDGCGRKFQVGENGHMIEAERDEAVIVADAFEDNDKYTIEGTPSQIASALNVMGGGKSFDKGAQVIQYGEELEIPQLQTQAKDTDVDDVIDSGSIIINRRSMADKKEYKVTGTPKQIASAINSINGNGVVIENGAEIKEN